MNNLQFWIWVVVIVITMIARVVKKKEPARRPPAPEPDRRQSGESDDSKPMSFEELLREIQAAKNQPVTSTPHQRVDYDDDLQEEAKSLEGTDYSTPWSEKSNEIYEKAKAEAFFRPSLEETLKLEDTVIRFGQFKGYQQADRVSAASELAMEIRNPSGFKKAFIMSEILKRRF